MDTYKIDWKDVIYGSIEIDAKRDPRICKNEDCVNKMEKQGKNDRMMRIMFFVFFIAIVAPVALQLFGFGR